MLVIGAGAAYEVVGAEYAIVGAAYDIVGAAYVAGLAMVAPVVGTTPAGG